jgi:AcrR family transcriptional regulator
MLRINAPSMIVLT